MPQQVPAFCQVDSEFPPDTETQEIWIHLLYSWQGKAFELHVAESDRYVDGAHREGLCSDYPPHRVYDLKVMLFSQTNVPPERQKILGLVKGKLPPEDARMYVLVHLSLTAASKC